MKRVTLFLVLLLIPLLILSGCLGQIEVGISQNNPSPTGTWRVAGSTADLPPGSPTLTATEAVESITASQPTSTLVPIASETTKPPAAILPTLAPIATSIPEKAIANAAIQFQSPGPLSRVVSPIIISGYAVPGSDNKGRVILFAEDGTVLAEEELQLNTAYTWAHFYWELPYQARKVGELGRLSMETRDEHGFLTAVNSVHLILLEEGFSIVNPPGSLKERCSLLQPSASTRKSGGVVLINGQMRPYNALPLVIELTDLQGSLLASQVIPVAPAADDRMVPFSTILNYSVTKTISARLTISQPDERIPGTMYLYSRELFIAP